MLFGARREVLLVVQNYIRAFEGAYLVLGSPGPWWQIGSSLLHKSCFGVLGQGQKEVVVRALTSWLHRFSDLLEVSTGDQHSMLKGQPAIVLRFTFLITICLVWLDSVMKRHSLLGSGRSLGIAQLGES